MTESAGYRSAVPHEALGHSPDLNEDGVTAALDLMTAVNGSYYPGDRSAAILSAIAWLQKNPTACAALGLNGTSVQQS